MSRPSNETEAEVIERRKVEALEAIAEHLETLADAAGSLSGVVDHLETLASVVQPARKEWIDPDGWGNPVPARGAYLRTDVD